MNKIPVDVEVEVSRDGEQIPKAVIWSDGRRFTISRVVYHGMSSSNEYEGIRYTVLIGSAEKYLYRIGGKWYVESIGTEADTG